MLNTRETDFAEVIGSSNPDTQEKAMERWIYLKSEYSRSSFHKEVNEGAKAIAFWVICMCALGLLMVIASLA